MEDRTAIFTKYSRICRKNQYPRLHVGCASCIIKKLLKSIKNYFIYRKKVTQVVELDPIRMELTSFGKPLVEMGDSL